MSKRVWWVSICALALAACGGGGSSSSGGAGNGGTPPPPAATYQVGGTLTGLPDGAEVVLGVGFERLTLRTNGSFSSVGGVIAGTPYLITVEQAPSDRRCVITGGSGTVAGANVTAPVVDCSRGLLWVTDGEVLTTALSSDARVLYIGGEFRRVGPPTGSWVRLDAGTSALRPGTPTLHGDITDAIPDGEGGHYVAMRGRGDSTSSLVRVTPQGTLDSNFRPPAMGPATALLRSGQRLFVAAQLVGSASTILPNNVQVLDATTGAHTGVGFCVTSSGPMVNALALDTASGTLYVGGEFILAGPSNPQSARASLAAFDANTGALKPWDAAFVSSGGTVRIFSLLLANGQLLVGGDFTQVGGVPRTGLAAVDTASAAVTAWAPINPNQPGGVVRRLVRSGNQVFVIGGFQEIAGVPRNRLAQLDLLSGLATSWDARLGSFESVSVMDVAVRGDTVWIAGGFGSVAGQIQPGVAAVSLADASLRSFTADVAAGSVHRVLPLGNDVWLGGNFRLYGGTQRRGAAALDTASGSVTPWNPQATDDNNIAGVDQILPMSAGVIVRGRFDSIGGARRRKLAALDSASGVALSWDPALPSGAYVYALAAEGGRLFVGGQFTSFGGQLRSNLAQVDTSSWTTVAWSPTVQRVWGMGAAGGRVYVSHDAGMQVFPATSDAALPWSMPTIRSSPANYPFTSVVATAGAVYIVGSIEWVDGDLRSAAALDPATGALLSAWKPQNGTRWTRLQLDERGTLFGVGERFNSRGQQVWDLARLDRATGASTVRMTGNNRINSVSGSADGLYVGGAFGEDGVPRLHLHRLEPE